MVRITTHKIGKDICNEIAEKKEKLSGPKQKGAIKFGVFFGAEFDWRTCLFSASLYGRDILFCGR